MGTNIEEASWHITSIWISVHFLMSSAFPTCSVLVKCGWIFFFLISDETQGFEINSEVIGIT